MYRVAGVNISNLILRRDNLVIDNKVLVGLATAVLVNSASGSNLNADVSDHYDYVSESKPVYSQECYIEQVPVYSSRSRESETGDNQLGSVIMGTVIGSAIGNAISDKHGAGTIGGIIGANEALNRNSSRDQQEITGYREVETCKPITIRENRRVRRYSHSVITFWLDGKRFEIPFQRY